MVESLSEKSSLCANSVILCVSVVELLKRTLTTEAQRSHREAQRRILRQTPKRNKSGFRRRLLHCSRFALLLLLAWPMIQTLPFQTDYYRRLRTLSFKNVESIIFDQMLPHIAHYWTRADMERLAGALEGGRLRIEFVQGNSWHANIARV